MCAPDIFPDVFPVWTAKDVRSLAMATYRWYTRSVDVSIALIRLTPSADASAAVRDRYLQIYLSPRQKCSCLKIGTSFQSPPKCMLGHFNLKFKLLSTRVKAAPYHNTPTILAQILGCSDARLIHDLRRLSGDQLAAWR